MLPLIAIVGRPNVGKSTLFNHITRSRDALVVDQPGVTRDRHYGEARFEGKRFLLVDTGGIGETPEGEIDELMLAQSWLAVEEADVVLFMVDGRAGVVAADEEIARKLRELNKPMHLVVNKTDGIDENVAAADFYALGIGEPLAIAASHNRGVRGLLELITENFAEEADEPEEKDGRIRMAIIGKPNVGKSTLVNRILGEERVIVCDMPGTTRDSIEIDFERQGEEYTLIDTAGVRRRGRIKDTVEKFSVVKTLQAIESANVVVFVFDAQDGLSEQDERLLGFVLETGKALVLAVNKWDGMESDERDRIKSEMLRRLEFVDFARKHFISALHGSGVGNLFESVQEAYRSAMRQITTAKATEILQDAIMQHQPPLSKGRRIKIRYAHLGGKNPPILVLHGTQVNALPNTYQRYLINFYRKRLHMVGTPIKLQLKSSQNPYVK